LSWPSSDIYQRAIEIEKNSDAPALSNLLRDLTPNFQ
jgi:hypothetical protein